METKSCVYPNKDKVKPNWPSKAELEAFWEFRILKSFLEFLWEVFRSGLPDNQENQLMVVLTSHPSSSISLYLCLSLPPFFSRLWKTSPLARTSSAQKLTYGHGTWHVFHSHTGRVPVNSPLSNLGLLSEGIEPLLDVFERCEVA